MTIPTVSMPRSLQIFAMIGAPPVPVPPPIPAVINAILVFTSSMRFISSNDSSVACLPISGLAPTPRPCVRCGASWIRLGIALLANACASVLQIIKLQPSITWLCMWLTALPPPPPTPITFIMDDFSLGRSKCIIVIDFKGPSKSRWGGTYEAVDNWVSCFKKSFSKYRVLKSPLGDLGGRLL